MNRNRKKIAVGCIIASLSVGTVLVTTATPSILPGNGGKGSIIIDNSDFLPEAGVTRVLDKSLGINSLETFGNAQTETGTAINTTEQAAEASQPEAAAAEAAVAPEEAPVVESPYADIAIAQVNNYVNIRSLPGEEGEILGKLYNNSAATILGEENGWYQITSGTVQGYVKAQYVVSGQEAEAIAAQVGHRVATVTTQTLRVRDNVGLDAPVQTLVPMGEELEVKEELEGWVRVALDADVEGFVSADYVSIRTEFVQAESIAEEQARLEEERRQKEAAEEAARKADEEAKAAAAKKKAQAEAAEAKKQAEAQRKAAAQQQAAAEQQAAAGQQAATPSNSGSVSGIRQTIVNYALKFLGNKYRYGGTSLTNGTDCSGFVQSVYRDCGISIGRSSRDQAAGGTKISISELQPGDLLFYAKGSTINHVALYIGNGQVVHASSPSTGIRISNYNYRTPCKAVRYLP